MSHHLYRSLLYVPAFRQNFMLRAKTLAADIVIYDLEDSVPSPLKCEARKVLSDFALSKSLHKRPMVRINEHLSNDFVEDLDICCSLAIPCLMPSMIRQAEDIFFISEMLSKAEERTGLEEGSVKLFPLIETAAALLNVREICLASSRIAGLAFGGQDYLTDLDAFETADEVQLLYARSTLVNIGAALHLPIIDTPFLDVSDNVGLKKSAKKARSFGFSGKLLIHPGQIECVNQEFSPSEKEVDMANRLIGALNSSHLNGNGIAVLDGRMIGPPMEKRARTVLRKYSAIKQNE